MSKVSTIMRFTFFLSSVFPLIYCQQVVPLTTKKGPIVGIRFDPNPATGVSYDGFLGIPYGEQPARFQLPEPRSKWTLPLTTQTDGAPCPQPGSTFSEDCLHLNVFTPMGASSTPGAYPVLVYIHGAAFTQGSSTSTRYGPDYFVNSSVILVAMNYRIGSAGFLTMGSKVAPGNLGLHDTVLALQWVRDEISAFGGDPSRVTLFGQSSGSAMTQMHYLSPLTADLFTKMISHSGGALADWSHYTPTEGARRARLLADAVGCDSTQNDTALLSCLQKTDINKIVNSQNIDLSDDDVAAGNGLRFIPVLDTYLTATKPFFNATNMEDLMVPALARARPILTGFNTDEGILKFGDISHMLAESHLEGFIPFKASVVLSEDEIKTRTETIRNRYFKDSPVENKVEELVTLFTEAMFAYPSMQVSRYFANFTYSFLFAYDGSWASTSPAFAEYKMKGVSHGAELSYLFYSNSRTRDDSTCKENIDNIIINEQMVRWWTTFIKTGVPDPEWPTVADGGYRIIDTTISTMNATAFESHYYDFWASMAQVTGSGSSERLSIVPVFVAISLLFTRIFC